MRSFQGGFELSKIKGIISPAYTIFDFIKPEQHGYEYWEYKFKTFKFIQSLKTVTFGIRDGKSISFKEFSDLKLEFPINTIEQKQIESFLLELDNLIASNQRAPFPTISPPKTDV